jgi:hypothetical protein
MTRQRAKALSREIAVLVTVMRARGFLRAGVLVEKLCALAEETVRYLVGVVDLPQELAATVERLRRPGVPHAGNDVARLCRLAEEARPYLAAIAAMPRRGAEVRP